jgi:hypothetical protein
VQSPLTHVLLLQADELVQDPFVLQVCGVLPAHCVWLGAQDPVHDPLTHVVFVQGTGAL